MKVNLINNYKDFRFSKKKIENFLEKVFKLTPYYKKIKNNIEINLLIVSSQKIKVLNKKYRKKDKATDVLSFSYFEGEQLVLPKQEAFCLGEIIMSWPYLKKQAKNIGNTNEKEFKILIVHGFLHLLGYDHEVQKDFKAMNLLEKKAYKLDF